MFTLVQEMNDQDARPLYEMVNRYNTLKNRVCIAVFKAKAKKQPFRAFL